MSLAALTTAGSGLQTAAAMYTASAHNVANLSSEDVHPQQAISQESPLPAALSAFGLGRPVPGGGAMPIVLTSPAPTRVDLVREMVTLSAATAAYRANLVILEEGSGRLRELVDRLA